MNLHLLPLKAFGSSYFVHDFGPGLDKLSAQSHKYVILEFTSVNTQFHSGK